MGRTIRRRRMEAKTDYKARLALLKSEKPRIVIRKTGRYIIAQVVISETAQDKVVAGVTSKDLIAKGWPENLSGSLKSLPASYLSGLLLGKKVKGKIKEAILDIGMQRNVKKSRIFAALKGFIDSGVSVPHDPVSLPDLSVIQNNKDLKEAFSKVLKGI